MTSEQLEAFFQYLKQAVSDGRVSYEQALPVYVALRQDQDQARADERDDEETKQYFKRMELGE